VQVPSIRRSALPLMQTFRALGIAAVSIAGLALLHTACQSGRLSRERRRFTPPGRLVYVHGRQVHCLASLRNLRPPTVVLESGLGSTATSWKYIYPRVSAFADVVACDRAGLGWSSPGATPRDARTITAELHDTLAALGTHPPYLLVGHSLGALYTRVFAGRYPDEVAGLVWLDPTHPDQYSRLPAEVARADEAWFRQVRRAPLLARLGLIPWSREAAESAGEEELFRHLPAHLEATRDELDAWEVSMAQARSVTHLPDVPLLVLSADPPHARGMREWHVLHAELAHLAERGVHRVVHGADHDDFLDQPILAAATAGDIECIVRVHREGGHWPPAAAPLMGRE
jgi:pimeloyl-ACP methyl ester carboxylesterase